MHGPPSDCTNLCPSPSVLLSMLGQTEPFDNSELLSCEGVLPADDEVRCRRFWGQLYAAIRWVSPWSYIRCIIYTLQ